MQNIIHQVFFVQILIEILVLAIITMLIKTIYKIRHHRSIQQITDIVQNIQTSQIQINNEQKQPLNELYIQLASLQNNIKNKQELYDKIFDILNSVATNIELDSFFSVFAPKLLDATNSQCAAFYLVNEFSNKLEIRYSTGFSKNIYGEFDLLLGEGFLTNITNTKEIEIITDIPDDTNYITKTFLGTIVPKSIMLIPILNEEKFIGLLVLSSITNYQKEHIEIVNLTKHYIGIAVNNGIITDKSKRLTNELKFQNKLIQDLNNDLEKKILNNSKIINDIINNIPSLGIFTFDENNIITSWNLKSQEFWCIANNNIVGQNVEKLYKKDSKLETFINNCKNSSGHENFSWTANNIINSFGKFISLQNSIYAMHSDDNSIIGFIVISKELS